MKKSLVFAMLLVLPLIGMAQSFDKFEEMDDVSAVVVSKKAFQLIPTIDVDDPDAKEFMKMLKNLSGLKVFATSNASASGQMQSAFNSYVKSNNLEELMRVKDKDANVKFYVKSGKDADHVMELIMFINGATKHVGNRDVNTVLLKLTGDIDLNQISKLTSSMDIPGGNELKKVGNK
ncbi:DUF4252 domain-containing protein [Zhouia sp. PK063]|uniref:DUF4252 domain-containing protein n=1 Tax=Zhouia sp. PK063 TaxID=3373602 RepID=UPI0037B7DF13